jgi:hypothetical protein
MYNGFFWVGPLVSSTNKTDRHDIIEILLSDVKHHQTNKQTYSGREQLQQYHKTIENSGRNETTTQQLLTATETTTQQLLTATETTTQF